MPNWKQCTEHAMFRVQRLNGETLACGNCIQSGHGHAVNVTWLPSVERNAKPQCECTHVAHTYPVFVAESEYGNAVVVDTVRKIAFDLDAGEQIPYLAVELTRFVRVAEPDDVAKLDDCSSE